jgi:EpsD family peptidyl-prolyl cis-trans isomerase
VSPIRSRSAPTYPLLAAVALAVLLAGCGPRPGAGDPAVKVNGDAINVQQIEFLLAQQRGLKPEQADAVGRQVLERLIEQQLAAQKAVEQKLDTTVGVQQAFEVARREILARAYLERVGEAAPKPTPDEIDRAYNERPALFRDRKVYNLQEIGIEAQPGQVDEIRRQLSAATNVPEFVDWLRRSGYRFGINQAVRLPEQLPGDSLQAISRLQDGQAMVVPAPQGVNVVVLVGSRPQPATLEQARPLIEQTLLGERRQKLAQDDMKAMRAAAKVEYVGRFAAPAGGAASAPAKGATGG